MSDKKPTPEGIDQMAQTYKDLLAQQDALDNKVAEVREYLLERVQAHGSVPPRADKSKRLEGIQYQITASTGESIEIDAATVEKFKEACSEQRLRGFFDKVFKTTRKYSLASGAQTRVEEAPQKLRSIFARALRVKTKSPRLEVELRKSASA